MVTRTGRRGRSLRRSEASARGRQNALALRYHPTVATIFTQIIEGKLPGRFVYRDERAVAFLTLHPLQPGHTLVVPVDEVDHWLDASEDLRTHLFEVAHRVSRGLQMAFSPEKVALMVVGLEVPHLHIHLAPIRTLEDLDFKQVDVNAKPEDLDAAAEKIRAALRALGIEGVSN